MSFYLAGKLHLFDEKGHTVCCWLPFYVLLSSHSTQQVKAWASLTPLAGATLVAISRTMDYRHHWHDVLTGSILGLVVAYFSYRQYYPPLTSDISHLPYPPRYKRGGHEDPAHTRSPSAAPAVSFEEEGIHPRQPVRRYSDRPSDETEMRPGPQREPPATIDVYDKV